VTRTSRVGAGPADRMAGEQARGFSARHLGEVKNAVNWAVGFVFIAAILSVRGDQRFRVLDVELPRPMASVCISLVYIALCGAVLVHLARIVQHLGSATSSEVEAEMDSLVSHEWLINPFVRYKGRYSGYWGFVALIALYWLGLAGLYIVGLPGLWVRVIEQSVRVSAVSAIGVALGGTLMYVAPLCAVIGIGYGVMIMVQRIPLAAARVVEASSPGLAKEWREMAADLETAAETGIGIGGVVLLALMALEFFWDRVMLATDIPL